MPMSDFQHMPTVLHYAVKLEPQSTLDVGIGMGTYGFLLREFLDIIGERLDPKDWRMRIEGVEIFEAYRNPVWDYAYDKVHVGDARHVLAGAGKFDLILMNDVLEHFERDEARALIKLALQHGKALIATTPNRHYPQGSWAGNEAETHRSQLDASDFAGLVAETRVGVTTCYVCSHDPASIAKIQAAAPFCPVAKVALLPRIRRRARTELARVLSRER